MSSKRIFLSAATNEFGGLRVKLAAMLQRSGINVEYQEIFPQTVSDTVRKVGDLIKGCPLLVHIVGHNPGSVAAPAAVLDLLNKIPADKFLLDFPSLRGALGDLSGITYTQWEAFLALHYGVDLILYAPSDACVPGTKTLKSDFVQKQHLDRLLISRRYPDFCTDEADFIGKILADVYRHFGIPETAAPAAIPKYLPERNRHFRGRKADLVRLSDSLSRSTTIGITQQVAVFASGGVGKSSLALEFAWDCFASSPEKYPGGVFWCDCRGRDVASLAEGLAAFAGALGIDGDSSADALTTARRVRDRLAQKPQSLLILDNVVDSEQWKSRDWSELLPGGHCHRLLTTREENLGDHRIPMIPLDRLPPADARALLHAYRDDVSLEDNDDAVRAIINWFGGLAIGLTVVGIYLGINSTIPWDVYWKSLREKKLEAVRGTEDLAAPADYVGRIDRVIDDLFRSQSPAEQQALLYASMLPGDDVSDRWLIELLADDLAAGKIKGNTPPGYDSFPHTLVARLMKRGILVRSIDTPARKTLFLHQVIRERFRELLQRDPVRSRDVSAHIRQFAIRNYQRSCQWTQAIVESTGFVEAQKLFASMMGANCDPNVFTFTSLLAKADTYATAKEVVAQMIKAKCAPNVFTLNTLLSKADTYNAAMEVMVQMEEAKCAPDTVTFNTLLTKVETYEAAKDVMAQMQKARCAPDTVTFNTLLAKVETYVAAQEVMAQMKKANCDPTVVTFTTLLSKTDTYVEAKEVLAQMARAQCAPNVFTLNALLSKVDTYVEAKELITQQLLSTGDKPNVFTFSTLFSKKNGLPPVTEILSWYYAIPFHPSQPFNALIGSLTKLNRVDEAMAIVLEHPHLSAGQRLMRTFPDRAQAIFQSAKDGNPRHPTADFALGILAIETKRPAEARIHLEEALRRAVHPLQVKTIESKLKSLA